MEADGDVVFNQKVDIIQAPNASYALAVTGSVLVTDAAGEVKISSGDFKADTGYGLVVNNDRVVSDRQAHIADADGTLADITTKFNTLLQYLDADAGHGLLAGAP
jgi:hypothetical protein